LAFVVFKLGICSLILGICSLILGICSFLKSESLAVLGLEGGLKAFKSF